MCVYVCVCICVLYTHTRKYIRYTVEYYSANKIMPFAATWMELEMLTLSEVSQRQDTDIP